MAKLEWNLQEIFVNNQSFYDEINNVKRLIEDVKKYENEELDSTLLLNLLDKKWKIKELSNNILIYGSLMYYKNVNDDECIELKRVAETFNNDVNTTLNFIDRKILNLGFERISSFIVENPKLEIYKLSLHNLFRLEEHIQSDETNKKTKENNDSINEQLSIYNNLLRDIEYGIINVDGKEVKITSSNFAKYISSRDRDTRKQTYFVVNNAFEKEKDNFANLLNKIYGCRIENSNLEKYNSVLEKILFEENINPEIINKLIESVNNNLGLIQKYLKIKSDLLEIEEPHLYDFGVPLDSNLKIKYSLEEAKEIILNALEPLGLEYIEVVKILFDGHIDAELNEDKHQSITFSWNTYSFMNFRGAYIDLKNMIHEIGHIVNYYLSKKKQAFIYEDSTIFVGETASIVNEILLNRYLYKNAITEEQKMFYLSKEIENYFSSVFKQTMYTEFENDLYKIRTNSELTSEILCERYYSILKKYYGDNISYDQIANVEWTRLGHLYRWSYYPYKYATGLLIASVVVDSLVDKKLLSKENYIKFLSAGSSQYSLDLLKMLNIDLVNTNIIEAGFNVMSEDIKELQQVLSLNKK
ncbi:MAG: oligoendopeptidase F family protein [Bacilli bacterium]|nr:oligoendopeptidase F family protein [Bacilli bacterium]